jgi:hypothetical protein
MLGFRDKDMLSMSDLVSDFMELPPITRYESKEEPAVPAAAFPDKLIAPILAARNQSGPFTYAQELKNIPFPRMTAYGFRGDTRAPLKFKAEIRVAATGQTRSWMQGFLPNYTRPTHNEQVQAFKGTDAYKANPAATSRVGLLLPCGGRLQCAAQGTASLGHEERSGAGHARPARMGGYHGIPAGYAKRPVFRAGVSAALLPRT